MGRKGEEDELEQLEDGEEEESEALLLQLQLEILTEAYIRNDPDVHVDGDDLVGEIEGYVDPVRIKVRFLSFLIVLSLLLLT